MIDDLGAGGAQRQLCTLAVLLKQLGMDVSMLVYHPKDFYLPIIQQGEIEYKCIEDPSIPQRFLSLRRELRRGNQDVVLAFLPSPVLYAEFASIPTRKWGLVVSERSAEPGSQRGWRSWFRFGHLMADYITANSHTNRLMIEKSVPALKGRVITVYNSVDFDLFSPGKPAVREDKNRLRFVVAAKFRALKNPVLLMEAFALVKRKEPLLNLSLDWYGTPPGKTAPLEDHVAYKKVIDSIDKYSLQDCIKLRPPILFIADIYRNADAVILPSFYEGLSNVVCEAMACGRPVLMSNVSDAGNQVRQGYNGILFDPSSVADIANSILHFADLTQSEKDLMGRHGREMAEQMFDPSLVAAKYAEILSAAAQRKRISIDHWVPQVPESAKAFFRH
ncbi:MAG: glycosyltransferase family 4 protein [Thermoguttaceae bacterium]|jgi:glycosyltransferase involved in cell wall biosynthesis